MSLMNLYELWNPLDMMMNYLTGFQLVGGSSIL